MFNKNLYIVVSAYLFIGMTLSFAQEKLIYNFPLKKGYWEEYVEGSARLKVKSNDSGLVVNIIRSPTGAFNHIQLFAFKLKLQTGVTYLLKITASSNSESEIICKFHKPSPNWDSYQTPDNTIIDLEQGKKTYTEEITATTTTDASRFTLYFGQNKGGTEIIINSIKLYVKETNDGGGQE